MIIAGRLIKLLLILGVLAGVSYQIFLFGSNIHQSKVPAEILQKSRGIHLFQLETNKYIRFPMLNLTEAVRVATNAEFSESMDLRESSNKEPYIIEIQAYDSSGNLIETRNINNFTKTQFFFDNDWSMYLPYFYLESDTIPSETRVTTLNFRGTAMVSEIRLRRVDSNPNLKTIYARVYQPTGVSDSQLNFYWLNLMQREKERLASANLYPISLMKIQERQNLIKNLWTFVGAQGIPGEDYDNKILYSVVGPKGIPYDLNLLHSGNYVDDTHQLMIPINEDGGLIQVQIISADIIYPKYMKIWLGEPDTKIGNILRRMKPTEEASANKDADNKSFQFVKGQNIELTWRGRGLGETITHKEVVKDRKFTKEYKLDAGLLSISSNAPAYVNITRKTASGYEAIPSSPSSINLIRLAPNDPIVYEVVQGTDSEVAYRVDLRKISNKIFDQSNDYKVTYELLDTNDKVISIGDILVNQPLTKLDFAVRKGNLYISDKQRSYFVFAQNVAKIRFTGSSDLFIALYNRLNSFVREYVIPDDYKISGSKLESLRRTWFYKTPLDYEKIRIDQRTVMVKTQTRMIEENELVKTGVFQWQGIQPEGKDWQGFNILEKKNPNIPSRAEAAASEFSFIPTNQEFKINIIGFQGEKFVIPAMIYSGKVGGKLAVYMDGKEYFSAALEAPSGEFQIPNILVGEHTVLVKADDSVKLMMNYNPNNKLSYIKDYIVSLGNKTQSFLVEKENGHDKIVTINVYSDSSKPSKISLNISGTTEVKNQVTSSYTIRNREYQINFSKIEERDPKFIHTKQDSLYTVAPIFIKLGTDLPKGIYKIDLFTESAQNLYVSLSSIKAGLVDDRKMSTEIQNE